MKYQELAHLRLVAKLEDRVRLFEQALALHPEDVKMQKQTEQARRELKEERETPSSALPPTSARMSAESPNGFQRVRPVDLKDPVAVRKAIQVYEKLTTTDPGNKHMEGMLFLLRERLRSLVQPSTKSLSRNNRRRVDVL